MSRIWLPLAALGLMGAAAPDWRPLDPENTLVIDTSKGRMVVEMRPDLAPKAVERVKLLAREHVYDGLLFHRVIDGFVDQTGNPNNRDGGTSSHPDLPPEFTFRIPKASATVLVQRTDGVEGFVGATPIAGVGPAETQRSADGALRGWGAYCDGVVGLGRQADPNTSNSEIFFMRAPSRRLDHDYTVWGRVVQGMEVVRGVAVGEPPANPDRMVRVQVAADMAPAERPHLEVQDTRSAAFRRQVAGLIARKGPAFSVCDVQIAVRTP